MTKTSGRLIGASIIVSAAFAAQTALALDYPTKPVRLLVGFPPGGAVDVTARTLAPPASERLKQQVVVDNRGGAHGNIAAEIVARWANQSYTGPANSITCCKPSGAITTTQDEATGVWETAVRFDMWHQGAV